MQITAEQMMAAAIDAVRQQVMAEMTEQQPKAVLQRRLLIPSQATSVQAAPDKPVPTVGPLGARGYRKVKELDSPQSTLAPRSGVEAAGMRGQAIAEHPEIVSHLREEIREPQPGSEIPPWRHRSYCPTRRLTTTTPLPTLPGSGASAARACAC